VSGSITPGSPRLELPAPPPGRTGWPWTEFPESLPERMPDGAPLLKLSIVMPSYDQAQFIEESIRSVLLQGYPSLEFIIIDGGSTDGSVDIIKKYEPWLAYWVSEADRGQSHAINKGIQRATGDILLWLNSDDLCLPAAFARAASAFSAHPDRQLVIGQARLVNERGDIMGELRSQFTSWEELVTNPGNSVRQISTFFSRKLFDELGMVNENLHIAMDNELMVRFIRAYPPLVLTDYLTAYRTHPGAKTYGQLLKGYSETDKTRGRYLSDRRLRRAFRRRSSRNWLSLSETESFPPGERADCLLRAVRNRPSAFFARRFWASLAALAVGRLQRCRRSEPEA